MKIDFIKNQEGGIAIIAALLLPVLIGAMGLAVETGYWFMVQRQVQNAADMAAYSAAVRKSQNASDAVATEGAIFAAYGSGVSRTTGNVNVAFLDENNIEVVIVDTRERLFTRIFFEDSVTMSARAVASIGQSGEEVGVPVCMLAMSPDSDGAIALSGSAKVDLTGCALEARSTSQRALVSSGASKLTAACVNLAGGFEGNAAVLTECADVVTNGSVRDLPQQLRDMPALKDAASVPTYGSTNVNNQTLMPQDVGHASGLPMLRFLGGVTFRNSVTMESGVYIIDGGQFRTSGRTTIDGSAGIVIYLMNGARLNFGNNTTANFQAMQNGPWANVLLFDSNDAASRQTHEFVGARLTGVIYTPQATMEFGGGTGVDDGCFILVGDKFTFTGSANVTSSCDVSAFGLDVYYGGGVGNSAVRLVE